MTTALEITAVSTCKHLCHFCPQATLAREYKKGGGDFQMSMETFKTCIDKLPADVEVHFSGYAEPFFHPDCGRMMVYARDTGHSVHVYTTLMGMTENGLRGMEASRPHLVKIHVPDTVGLIVPDDEWIRLHEMFRQTGIAATYMAMGPLTPAIDEYMRQVGIQVELPTMLSRAGNNWTVENKKGKTVVCTMDRWHSNVLMPDGNVYGCCMDYGLTVPLGNLLRQSYGEIWKAAEEWKNNDHSQDICSRCEWARFE